MKLVAIRDTGRFACHTDDVTLSAAIAHRAPWMPAEGVLFLLADDEGEVVEPEVDAETDRIVEEMLHPLTFNWPIEAMVEWLNQKFVMV
jgi:hypothetical protein